MKVNIIDFEASALKAPSFPIQVAVIKEDGSTYDAFIRPTDNWINKYNWDPQSEHIHNIPLNTLIDIGKDVNVVAQELNDFIDGEDVFCDGGEYDVCWANELYCATPKINRRFKIRCISDLYDPQTLGMPIWFLKQEAALQMDLKEHDALNDVKIIQRAVTWRRNNYIPPRRI